MTGTTNLDRAVLIQNLAEQMDSLARSHIQHRLGHTEAIAQKEQMILQYIQEHQIDVMEELDPLHRYYYWRFLN